MAFHAEQQFRCSLVCLALTAKPMTALEIIVATTDHQYNNFLVHFIEGSLCSCQNEIGLDDAKFCAMGRVGDMLYPMLFYLVVC